MIPRDPAEIDALAAEYVLGTLEGQRDEVRHLLEHGADPGSDEADLDAATRLRMAVSWWEQHLAGLATALPPVPPPPDVWAAIERHMATAPTAEILPFTAKPASRTPLKPLESLAVWRLVAGAAIAACLALVVRSATTAPTPVSAVALLAPAGGATQATGTFLLQREGSQLRVTAVGTGPTPPGRDLELWSLKGGVPAPLGIVHSTAYLAPAPFATPSIVPSDTTLAISVEPIGGSPTGKPMGPALYIGKLTDVTGS